MTQTELEEKPESGTEKLILKRQHDGGDISVVEELPEPEFGEVRESHNEVGRNSHEFPLSRDRYNTEITKYDRVGGDRGRLYSELKVFEMNLDKEVETLYDKQDIVEKVKEVKKLPELKERIKRIASYEEMCKKQSLIRKYERIYSIALDMYHKSSLTVSNSNSAPMFEIEQAPQGFYKIAMFHHRNVNEIMSQYLEKKNLGFYNIVWGGFIVKAENFTDLHEVFKPFKHTPEDSE